MFNGAIGWNHPEDESDQWDGFNEPGIEHFRGNPIFHLAREINQNSLDAVEDGLVNINFIFREVDTKLIPNLDELKETINHCLQASQSEGEKARSFFENAKKTLSKKRIGVLEISDSNTTGLRGPAINGTPFYAFMKATGQSKKDSQTASGSYGIGKFAPYAVSSLRTIFVSSVYSEGDGEYQQLTQGKSVLMSHEDKKSKRKRGVGFWGIRKKCQPITGNIPKANTWLQRATGHLDITNKGTTITILGFEPASNWRQLLAVSAAENFFGAISGDKLNINIDNQIILSRDTIDNFFTDDQILKVIENQKNEPDHFAACQAYLAAIQNHSEVRVEETQHSVLGLCRIRILTGENLPKKVCILRNGMLITDELNRLKSFPDFKEFVAVVECLNPQGNEFLREMEPPRHDDFEPDRLTKEKQAKGRKALSDLAKWVRDMLKRHAKDPISDVTTLDELKDFFGDEFSDGNGEKAEEVNPAGEIVIRARPLRRKFSSTSKEDEDTGEGEGEDGGGSGNGDGNGNGDGGNNGDGNGDNGAGNKHSGKKLSEKLHNVRAVMTGANARKISFTPTVTGTLRMYLMRAGADADHDIKVIESSQGTVEGGSVIMDVTADCRTNLEVKIEKNFDGSMKVVAYEI